MYYCDRPHVKTITSEMRYIVCSSRGVDLGEGKVFKQGDEFPGGAVSKVWLKLLYDQRRIDLMPEGDARLAPVSAISGEAASQPPLKKKTAKR